MSRFFSAANFLDEFTKCNILDDVGTAVVSQLSEQLLRSKTDKQTNKHPFNSLFPAQPSSLIFVLKRDVKLQLTNFQNNLGKPAPDFGQTEEAANDSVIFVTILVHVDDDDNIVYVSRLICVEHMNASLIWNGLPPLASPAVGHRGTCFPSSISDN